MESQTITWTTAEVHAGPHIPAIQWEQINWLLTNTILTSLIFLFIVIIVAVFGNKALYSKKKSRLKQIITSYVGFFDNYLADSFWDKKFARNYFAVVVWVFSIILFWNLLGLVIDWLWAWISPTILHYFRPMHSDPNTTLVLATITIVMFLWIAIKTNWFLKTAKSYCFNFTWDNIWMKLINVFVWWLHIISIPSSMVSLSLRLFWNMFAWIVLIWVITFLWGMMSEHFFEVGKLLSLPFWFFEVFVAFIQAVVFMGLMIANFKSAAEEHH